MDNGGDYRVDEKSASVECNEVEWKFQPKNQTANFPAIPCMHKTIKDRLPCRNHTFFDKSSLPRTLHRRKAARNKFEASLSSARDEKKKRGQPPPISYVAFWWLPPKFVAAFTAILPPHSCLTSCNVSHLPRWRPFWVPPSECAGGAPDGPELFHKRHVCIDNPLLRSAGLSLPFDRSSLYDRSHLENVSLTRPLSSLLRTPKTLPFFAVYSFLFSFFPFVGTGDPTRIRHSESLHQFPLDLTNLRPRECVFHH